MPDMPTVATLTELEAVFEAERGELFVRWSHGPSADLEQDDDKRAQSSRDGLTGVPLPGLSANPLRLEPWWADRPLRLWLARRLHDYEHLRELRGPGVRPWVLRGRERARGPDNEPLVICDRPVAWISDDVLREAEELVNAQASPEWGPLARHRRPG
ncbi:hypothetical protein A4R43_06305 [Amycolatopsis albispora]|uniref:Uncharacterized protein n=2 Tax=Amycolatopsis albispora TaxID=1804986 RepID=A0A344LJT3_9PSEU|nr:hypothetical protein A4R43_06305 [Amycolatopsis albispora]